MGSVLTWSRRPSDGGRAQWIALEDEGGLLSGFLQGVPSQGMRVDSYALFKLIARPNPPPGKHSGRMSYYDMAHGKFKLNIPPPTRQRE